MIIKESPLKGMSVGSVATVAIRELPVLPATDLRVLPGTEAQEAVSAALGIELSAKTGQVLKITANADVHALCLGPDWWLITGMDNAESRLEPLKDDHHISVVDVSGQRTIIKLEGPHARAVLAHLWEQDLRDKTFPVGSVSQGLMVKSPVIVWRVGPLHYRVLVRSSFAFHLWQALVDATVEWV